MKKGFTLAEILITLGIVGVVAVLTVPAVMRGYNNKLYVTQLSKAYSQLTDATLAIMEDEHVDDFYETKAGRAMNEECTASGNCTQGLGYLLNNYFEYDKKNCGNGSNLCIPTSYTTISGAAAGSNAGSYCIQTTGGATICGWYNAGNSCMSLSIDVNGPEKPNVTGRDLFSMDIHKDGSISDYNSGCLDGAQGCSAASCSADDDKASLYTKACGCLTRVMEAGWKMEY